MAALLHDAAGAVAPLRGCAAGPTAPLLGRAAAATPPLLRELVLGELSHEVGCDGDVNHGSSLNRFIEPFQMIPESIQN
jgi:hypothetical protein